MNNTIDTNFAAKLYGNVTQNKSDESGEGSGDSSFMGMVKNAAQDGIKSIRDSEEVSARAIAGDADITEVVAAVNSAELTLQTIVAVRDRMISAYQEIMRMPM